MGQDALTNRCLWDVTNLSHDECRIVGDLACGRTERVEFSDSVRGFQGLTFRPRQLYPTGSVLQYFSDWEKSSSNLVQNNSNSVDAKPVVGEQILPGTTFKTPYFQIQCYPIVGHIVTANVQCIYVCSTYGVGGSLSDKPAGERLKSVLDNGFEAFVDSAPPKTNGLSVLGTYSSGLVLKFTLYVDANGKILALLGASSGEAGLEHEDPISYLMMAPELLKLGKLGTKLIWSTLSRRAAAKTVITETIEKRLIARGASSELAELATLS